MVYTSSNNNETALKIGFWNPSKASTTKDNYRIA